MQPSRGERGGIKIWSRSTFRERPNDSSVTQNKVQMNPSDRTPEPADCSVRCTLTRYPWPPVEAVERDSRQNLINCPVLAQFEALVALVSAKSEALDQLWEANRIASRLFVTRGRHVSIVLPRTQNLLS